MTPSRRVIIASIRWPSSRISGPASEQAEQGQQQGRDERAEHDQRFGQPLAARHQQHDRGDRAGPGDHRDRHREDRNVLGLARADLLGAVLAALGALLEHHVDRDQEQQDAAGDAEGARARCRARAADPRRAGRRRAGCRRRWRPSGTPSPGGARGVAPAVRLAKIGAQPGGSITTRKVTKAETNSSVIAPPAPAGRRGACAATRVLRKQHGDGHRPDAARHRGDRAGDLARRSAKSTSPTSLPSTRLMPTSITVAPGFSQSPLTISGRPTAATTMSARRTTSGRSRVRLWAMVTVQFSREQQLRHRLADDVRAADHHRLEARQGRRAGP